MLLDRGLNDGQPQPCSAGLPIARFIGTIKRAEDLFAVFRANARAIVINRYRNAVFIHREADFNLRVRIAQGVTDNVLQRAFQCARVAL